MYITYLYLTVIIVIAVTIQTVSADEDTEKWEIKIRRTMDDKNQIVKPAQLSFTVPEIGPSSYAMDVGISAIIPPVTTNDTHIEIGFGVEYYRNSGIDAVQDTYTIGAFTNMLLGDVTGHSKNLLYPQVTIKYKVDKIAANESLYLSFDATGIYNPLLIGNLVGNSIGFIWQPKIGIHNENIIESKDSSPTGNIVRLFFTTDVALYPLRNYIDDQFIIWLTYSYWNDVSESSALDNNMDNHNYFNYGLTYYFDNNSNYRIGITLENIDGENPETGLATQKYTRLSINLKR